MAKRRIQELHVRASTLQKRLLELFDQANLCFLAARLPGGTAWCPREVAMWKRSEVERLTGLTRHMIQDLCNPNTSGDGLGFWVPAVAKPGYSRFDEGDLLAFYLVRQLMKAGFTLKEVEPAVFGMLERDDTFASLLAAKEHRLGERRSRIEASLAALETLEEAAELEPDDRLLSVMFASLQQSAERALAAAEHDAAAVGEPVDASARQRVAERVHGIIAGIVLRAQGDLPQGMRGAGAQAFEKPQMDEAFQRAAERLAQLIEAGEKPGGRSGRALARELAERIAGSPDADAARYALRVEAHFLSERENGVPVELVLGNGSFAFLAQATAACVGELNKQGR